MRLTRSRLVIARPQARVGSAGDVRRFWTVRAFAPITGQPTRAEIDIYGVIGEDTDEWTGEQVGVSAQAFLDEVRAIGPVDELQLNINSPGGDAFDGSAIYGVLSQLPCRKVAVIQGLCASAATVIASACDEVRMSANALYMIHDPSTIVAGNAADLAQATAMLGQLKAAMVAAYSAKNQAMDDEAIEAAMSATTWYTAEEAKAAGWVNSVLEPVAATAFSGLDLARFRGKVPEALAQAVAEAPAPEAEPAAVETPAPVTPEQVAATVATSVAEAFAGFRSEFVTLLEGLKASLPAAAAKAEVTPTAAVVEPPSTATPEQVDAASREALRAIAEENGLVSVFDSWVRAGSTTAQIRAVINNRVAAKAVNVSSVPEQQPQREVPAPKAELTPKVVGSWFDTLNAATAKAASGA
ncbi:head maturation protease, ClpP-related [Methylobacterium sp. DCY52]|uniref:head maturation protease, ClpP-related n=1 Tax=Methylobacterium sp. DCY52 TaxID=739139 RepID=UPI0031451CD5